MHDQQLTEEFVVGDIRNLHMCVTKIGLYNHGIYSPQDGIDLLKLVREYSSKYEIKLYIDPSFQKWVDSIIRDRQYEKWEEEDA